MDEEMNERKNHRNDQILRILKELGSIGEEITFEQGEKMLESMQQLVTLVINQYFRELQDSNTNSSTKQ